MHFQFITQKHYLKKKPKILTIISFKILVLYFILFRFRHFSYTTVLKPGFGVFMLLNKRIYI